MNGITCKHSNFENKENIKSKNVSKILVFLSSLSEWSKVDISIGNTVDKIRRNVNSSYFIVTMRRVHFHF